MTDYRYVTTIKNDNEHTFEMYNGDHRNRLWGRTGRLYKSMVEGSEIASNASAGHLPTKFAGYFSFNAETA